MLFGLPVFVCFPFSLFPISYFRFLAGRVSLAAVPSGWASGQVPQAGRTSPWQEVLTSGAGWTSPWWEVLASKAGWTSPWQVESGSCTQTPCPSSQTLNHSSVLLLKIVAAMNTRQHGPTTCLVVSSLLTQVGQGYLLRCVHSCS